MRMLAGCLLFVSGLSAASGAQDHANCPMAGSDHHRAQVDSRHDDATSVPHEQSVHHFLLAADGGSIRLEANDTSEREVRDAIRKHLLVIVESFSAGDFSLPMLIHDQVPPGVEVMKSRRSAIHYAYSPTENGGVVRISTRDAKALEAIHAFLRFQIRDHGTADSAG